MDTSTRKAVEVEQAAHNLVSNLKTRMGGRYIITVYVDGDCISAEAKTVCNHKLVIASEDSPCLDPTREELLRMVGQLTKKLEDQGK